MLKLFEDINFTDIVPPIIENKSGTVGFLYSSTEGSAATLPILRSMQVVSH